MIHILISGAFRNAASKAIGTDALSRLVLARSLRTRCCEKKGQADYALVAYHCAEICGWIRARINFFGARSPAKSVREDAGDGGESAPLARDVL